MAKRPISRCLHVGNVGIKASEEDLEKEFGEFGEIEDIKIVHQGGRNDPGGSPQNAAMPSFTSSMLRRQRPLARISSSLPNGKET